MKRITCLIVFAALLPGCQRISLDTDNTEIQIADTAQLAKVQLSVDKTRYSSSDTIRVTLYNGSENTVFLEGCSQLYLEAKTDSGWTAQPLVVCVWEGFAVELAADSTFQKTLVAENLNGLYRMSAPVYLRCQSGKPISQAECGRRELLRSAEFIVE